MDIKAQHWAIVGGGMLGLTLALRLAQSGQRVSVFEGAKEFGGLTSSANYGSIVWDRFYHVVADSDAHLLSLLEELGLLQHLHWGSTNTNFYDGRSLYPLNNALDYVRLPVLSLVDKTRLAVNILYASLISDGSSLENQTAEAWLVRWSGRKTYQSLWRPLLKTKLGDNVEKASAAYIWSIIKRFYGARSGAKQTENFGFIDGGYARVIKALLEQLADLGVELKADYPVRNIASANNQLTISSHEIEQTFDKVIFTGSSKTAAELCDGLSNAESKAHGAISYQGVICSSILLKKPLGGAYMTYITDESIPFTTVIEMSSLTGSERYARQHLCYLPKYLPSDHSMFDLPNAEVEKDFLKALYRMFPHISDDDVLAIDTARQRYVTAIPTLHYSKNLPPARTSMDNLYICNSAQIINAALAVNETVELANRSINEMFRARQ